MYFSSFLYYFIKTVTSLVQYYNSNYIEHCVVHPANTIRLIQRDHCISVIFIGNQKLVIF